MAIIVINPFDAYKAFHKSVLGGTKAALIIGAALFVLAPVIAIPALWGSALAWISVVNVAGLAAMAFLAFRKRWLPTGLVYAALLGLSIFGFVHNGKADDTARADYAKAARIAAYMNSVRGNTFLMPPEVEALWDGARLGYGGFVEEPKDQHRTASSTVYASVEPQGHAGHFVTLDGISDAAAELNDRYALVEEKHGDWLGFASRCLNDIHGRGKPWPACEDAKAVRRYYGIDLESLIATYQARSGTACTVWCEAAHERYPGWRLNEAR